MQDGKAWSRKFKLIPNQHIQAALAGLPEGLDGELVCPGGFNATQSQVMTIEGEPEFVYLVFDWVVDSLEEPYSLRATRLPQVNHDLVCPVMPIYVNDVDSLMTLEDRFVSNGYEGVCARSPDSRYKCGRSTLKEQCLLKMKRFADGEATIIGWEPLYENQNPQERDELGYAKRSSAQAGLAAKDMLGALHVRDRRGRKFWIGSGFTTMGRIRMWQMREKLPGAVITFKYQPYGEKDVPRFPVFKGFRHAFT